ncbi:hypothetical protein E2C01_002332 [Portunus trituberculatus]|uniref:Uncharacterized protein n=1 Tax=Portunus trituberculatus TaxID=210409 RepID=A0A5B7CJ39_PORTR|nr:hypothetical protein [Portunus trituberculatus]
MCCGVEDIMGKHGRIVSRTVLRCLRSLRYHAGPPHSLLCSPAMSLPSLLPLPCSLAFLPPSPSLPANQDQKGLAISDLRLEGSEDLRHTPSSTSPKIFP